MGRGDKQLNHWHELLKNHKATLYSKPTRFKHESGFRTFETGYCTIGADNRIAEKLKLGEYRDHINLDFFTTLVLNRPIPLNMDLTIDGYIRIWNYDKEGYELKWEWDDGWALSSMSITTFKAEIIKREKLNNFNTQNNE